MTAWQEHRGIILFCMIAVVVLIAAFAALQISGPAGIEDRFHAATGITAGEEVDVESGIAGFFLEGNTLRYILVLACLLAAGLLVYRKYRI